MANRTDSYSLPPAVKRVAVAFRWVGWGSFWVQLILAIFSAVALASASISLNAPAASTTPGVPAAPVSSGTGPGVFLAVCGLVALFGGAYWAFSYVRLSRKLKLAESQGRPKRGDAIQSLRIGLTINLVGMLLALLGAQAIVGPLVLKSLNQGFVMFSGRVPQFISTPDILAVQANTNTIMAHFVGLLATLWLIRSMNRQ